ncbi:MAG: bifunctional folylpolyglutamate synthase/dihydrofolate synthase [Muribaculaceae bacterium]
MNYQESIDYLFGQVPMFQRVGANAYKPGLDTSISLAAMYGNPQDSFKTIHVAGTNGKGSVSHTIAAILQESGYKVGLYTSPHLVDFRERIRVNGEMIPRENVVEFVEKYKSLTHDLHPSFFELTMMMAFDYFRSAKVDVAVIEVGLGGRLDSTNIITPELCVITNISFDHMQFLGDTLPKIASEKAGIMKHGIPVVIGEAEGDVRKVFEDKAAEVGAPIVFAQDEPCVRTSTRKEDYIEYYTTRYGILESELVGECQKHNANTILKAVDLLSRTFTIGNAAVGRAFRNVCSLTGLMGRWMKIGENPRVICDTGHNEGGIKYIAKQLKEEKYNVLRIVIGFVSDKDVSHIINLLPSNAKYYFTQAQIPRAMNSETLRDMAVAAGLRGEAFPSVEAAFNAAMSEAKADDMIYVGGSTFVVADFLTQCHSK